MKNLILASILGSAAAGFAVPALTGPVHFAITRPYSMFGWLPTAQYPAIASVTLGTAPLDFILTDVMLGGSGELCLVTVNGNPVLNLGNGNSQVVGSTHLTTGVFIPAGSVVGVQFRGDTSGARPVTLAGYVQ